MKSAKISALKLQKELKSLKLMLYPQIIVTLRYTYCSTIACVQYALHIAVCINAACCGAVQCWFWGAGETCCWRFADSTTMSGTDKPGLSKSISYSRTHIREILIFFLGGGGEEYSATPKVTTIDFWCTCSWFNFRGGGAEEPNIHSSRRQRMGAEPPPPQYFWQ